MVLVPLTTSMEAERDTEMDTLRSFDDSKTDEFRKSFFFEHGAIFSTWCWSNSILTFLDTVCCVWTPLSSHEIRQEKRLYRRSDICRFRFSSRHTWEC